MEGCHSSYLAYYNQDAKSENLRKVRALDTDGIGSRSGAFTTNVYNNHHYQ
jgi:hypothetical protein